MNLAYSMQDRHYTCASDRVWEQGTYLLQAIYHNVILMVD